MPPTIVLPGAALIGIMLGFIGCSFYMVGTKIESDNTAGVGFALLGGGIATVFISLSQLTVA